MKSGLFLREFVTKPWVHLTSPARPTTARPCRSRPAARPACRTRPSWSWRWPVGRDHGRVDLAAVSATAGDAAVVVEPLTLILGAAGGGARGRAADRFATRWPPHDEEHPPHCPVDWRTVLCGVVGAVSLGLLPIRFGGDTLALLVFGAWFVTLIIGLATDLDLADVARRADAGHPDRAGLCDLRA